MSAITWSKFILSLFGKLLMYYDTSLSEFILKDYQHCAMIHGYLSKPDLSIYKRNAW